VRRQFDYYFFGYYRNKRENLDNYQFIYWEDFLNGKNPYFGVLRASFKAYWIINFFASDLQCFSKGQYKISGINILRCGIGGYFK